MKYAKTFFVLAVAMPFAITIVTPASAIDINPVHAVKKGVKAAGNVAKGAVKGAGKVASTVGKGIGKGAQAVGKGAVAVGKGAVTVGGKIANNPVARTVGGAPIAGLGVVSDVARGKKLSTVAKNAADRSNPIRNMARTAEENNPANQLKQLAKTDPTRNLTKQVVNNDPSLRLKEAAKNDPVRRMSQQAKNEAKNNPIKEAKRISGAANPMQTSSASATKDATRLITGNAKVASQNVAAAKPAAATALAGRAAAMNAVRSQGRRQ